jgi:hypothetical protein
MKIKTKNINRSSLLKRNALYEALPLGCNYV